MNKTYYNTCLMAMTLSHFCEDCMCALLLYTCFTTKSTYVLAAALLYHVLAFGLQPVVGVFCDLHTQFSPARLGILMTMAACLLAVFLPLPAVFLAGLGNSLFHVGGGYVSLHHGSGRMGPGGVFVSGGAMGIAVGSLLGSFFHHLWLMIGLTLLLGGVSFFLTGFDLTPEQRGAGTHFQVLKRKDMYTVCLLLIIFSIVVRGYVGFIAPMDWKNAAWMALLTSGAATLGKASGGFLADRFRPGLVACICQLMAIPCLLAGSCMPLSLLGIVLLNLPMAITLAMLCECYEKNTGIAFGLAPLGLFIAYMMTMSFALSDLTAKITLSILLLLSAGIMKGLAD